jgi:NADPH-dependent ferric siderophore reductase
MPESLPVSLIEVVGVDRVTPRVARVTFAGGGLADFVTWPDQQAKLCFPKPGQRVPRLPGPDPDGDAMRWYLAYVAIPEAERPWMRSFTIRSYDQARSTIDVDVVLHGEAGPATRFGRRAQVGDTLGMVGPQAIYTRALPPASDYLFAGDETALPAIGSLLAALPADVRAHAYVEILDPAEEQSLDSPADLTVHWVHRAAGGRLVDAVREMPALAGATVAWLAGEASAVRALRRYLVDERGLAKRSVEFSGYWRRDLTQDDAPTPADLAEAQERLAGTAPPPPQ